MVWNCSLLREFSYSKCSNWRQISKVLLCSFIFCYLDGANSIKTDLHICNFWTGYWLVCKLQVCNLFLINFAKAELKYEIIHIYIYNFFLKFLKFVKVLLKRLFRSVQKIKPHPTSLKYPLINYLVLFGFVGLPPRDFMVGLIACHITILTLKIRDGRIGLNMQPLF